MKVQYRVAAYRVRGPAPAPRCPGPWTPGTDAWPHDPGTAGGARTTYAHRAPCDMGTIFTNAEPSGRTTEGRSTTAQTSTSRHGNHWRRESRSESGRARRRSSGGSARLLCASHESLAPRTHLRALAVTEPARQWVASTVKHSRGARVWTMCREAKRTRQARRHRGALGGE
jgi:hypothetical protein